MRENSGLPLFPLYYTSLVWFNRVFNSPRFSRFDPRISTPAETAEHIRSLPAPRSASEVRQKAEYIRHILEKKKDRKMKKPRLSLSLGIQYAQQQAQAFQPGPQHLQLYEKKSRLRVNRDRRVREQELYDALFPTRKVTCQSSFQMTTAAGQKQSCFNVYRHQDVGVLHEDSLVFENLPHIRDINSPLTPETPYSVQRQVGTLSGYTLRGFGYAQTDTPQTLGIADKGPAYTTGQMYVGPGCHQPFGIASGNPSWPTFLNEIFQDQAEWGQDVYGGRDNISWQTYLSRFPDSANSPNVRLPSLRKSSCDVGEIMAMCPTLWSPICCQSIEAASANLGYNALGKGTVDSVDGFLDRTGDFATTPSGNFLPTGGNSARSRLDAQSTQFTWKKHSANYKFTNTYSYGIDIDVVIFKVGSLDHGSKSSTSVNLANNMNQAFYPGVNGPKNLTSADADFGSLWGSPSTTPNQSFLLKLIGSWTNEFGARTEKTEGIQLGAGSVPKYETPSVVSKSPCWPLLDARFSSFRMPSGMKSAAPFMREYSRKRISILPGECQSMLLDLGGFKYRLSDVGYVANEITTSDPYPVFDVNAASSAYSEEIHYVDRGMMNGSIVVAITIKGKKVQASAPLLKRTGPTAYAEKASGYAIDDHDTKTVVERLPVSSSTDPNLDTRGFYGTGVVHSAGSCLVECSETVEFQPMIHKRPKYASNKRTLQDPTQMFIANVPVSDTVRTVQDQSTSTSIVIKGINVNTALGAANLGLPSG